MLCILRLQDCVRSREAFTHTQCRRHRHPPAHPGRVLLTSPEGAVPHFFMLFVTFWQGQLLNSTSLVNTHQWVLSQCVQLLPAYH